jgi:hypothetical protein
VVKEQTQNSELCRASVTRLGVNFNKFFNLYFLSGKYGLRRNR